MLETDLRERNKRYKVYPGLYSGILVYFTSWTKGIWNIGNPSIGIVVRGFVRPDEGTQEVKSRSRCPGGLL